MTIRQSLLGTGEAKGATHLADRSVINIAELDASTNVFMNAGYRLANDTLSCRIQEDKYVGYPAMNVFTSVDSWLVYGNCDSFDVYVEKVSGTTPNQSQSINMDTWYNLGVSRHFGLVTSYTGAQSLGGVFNVRIALADDHNTITSTAQITLSVQNDAPPPQSYETYTPNRSYSNVQDSGDYSYLHAGYRLNNDGREQNDTYYGSSSVATWTNCGSYVIAGSPSSFDLRLTKISGDDPNMSGGITPGATWYNLGTARHFGYVAYNPSYSDLNGVFKVEIAEADDHSTFTSTGQITLDAQQYATAPLGTYTPNREVSYWDFDDYLHAGWRLNNDGREQIDDYSGPSSVATWTNVGSWIVSGSAQDFDMRVTKLSGDDPNLSGSIATNGTTWYSLGSPRHFGMIQTDDPPYERFGTFKVEVALYYNHATITSTAQITLAVYME